MDTSQNKATFKKLRKRYVFVFGVIILLSTISQAFIQYYIYEQKGDSKVVNIAGRQRMLSQKLALNFNRMYQSETLNLDYKKDLDEIFAELNSSHSNLKFGNTELGISAQKDTEVQLYLSALEGYLNEFKKIIKNSEERIPSKSEFDRFNLVAEQFLLRMNETVRLIENQNKRKVVFLSRIEIAIFLAITLFWCLELFFLILPTKNSLLKSHKSLVKQQFIIQKAENIAKLGAWEFIPSQNTLHMTPGLFKAFDLDASNTLSFDNFAMVLPNEFRKEFKEAVNLAKEMEFRFEKTIEFVDSKNETKFLKFEFESFDVDGENRLYGIVIDVTQDEVLKEQVDHERKINQHQSKLAGIGQLAAGIAHEINNPLAISSGAVSNIKSLLQKEDFDRSLAVSKMEKLESAIKRITNIVRGLRSYARGDVDEKAEFDATEASIEVYSLLTEMYQKDGVKLNLSLNSNLSCSIKGNRGRFQQVLYNIIGNAKDALKHKSNGEIKIDLDLSGNQFVLQITDNGPGIPQDIQAKIFDPFFTTKPVGSGTGLGLSISQNIVKELDGSLVIESEIDNYTKFVMSFPVAQTQIMDSKATAA